MSRIRIQHTTTYNYHRPVEFGRHRLVVRPREGHDVNVASLRLRIEPQHRLRWVRDVFGNSVAIVDFQAAATALVVESDVVIDRDWPAPVDLSHPASVIPFPVTYDPLETAVIAAYQQPSFPDELGAVRDWLQRCVPTGPDVDAEQLLVRLGREVHEQVKYLRRMEKGVQSPAQSIASQSGSCRDKATLMMDAARSLGLAARFASGYLDCPASEAGRAAMHAWVEVYLPTHGWWGFDPTINERVSLKHVVAGVSNHPRGVMPVSGSFFGTSADYMGMTAQVKIERLGAELQGNPADTAAETQP
jgi:transglutaminase-like putative cysteine protease